MAKSKRKDDIDEDEILIPEEIDAILRTPDEPKKEQTSNSRLKIGLFIFNELRDFPAKPFVNFLAVPP